jgi:hypothetical protein
MAYHGIIMEHDGDSITNFWGHHWNGETFLVIYHLYFGKIYITVILCTRLSHVTKSYALSNVTRSDSIMDRICY